MRSAVKQLKNIALRSRANGLGIARPTSLRPASFGGIAVLLFLVGSISACSKGFGTEADSVQTTLGGGVSSTWAKTAPREKILLEGVGFKPDGSGLRPNSQPILDSAVELLKSHPDMKVYVDTYCDPTGGKRLNLSVCRNSAQRSCPLTLKIVGSRQIA